MFRSIVNYAIIEREECINMILMIVALMAAMLQSNTTATELAREYIINIAVELLTTIVFPQAYTWGINIIA